MPDGATDTVRLTVNVVGDLVEVDIDPDMLLWNVMNQAFSQTGRTGEAWENWEMRDSDGLLLDIKVKVRAFDWTPGTTLFLNTKAAIGA